MSRHHDVFAPAVQTAHEWVQAVAERLISAANGGQERSERLTPHDHAFALRVLRAWLHTVRDRIPVNNSAHLAAQLPEVLRGIYYENWTPAHVPASHEVGAFVEQFAREANIARGAVGESAGAVTDALRELFSIGQLDSVFAILPSPLCAVLYGARTHDAYPADTLEHDPDSALRRRVQVLGEAVAVLARGLEPVGDEIDAHTLYAAHRVHRLLRTGNPNGQSRRR